LAPAWNQSGGRALCSCLDDRTRTWEDFFIGNKADQTSGVIMDKPATLVQVSKFFEFDNIASFRKEWEALSDTDRDQIKQGIGNGSLNY
jgi:hypothetical protein